MADNIKGEMIRGQIDTVIMLALTDGEKDSNSIITAIEEKSDNQYTIKQGTFYSAMQRLVKGGLIKERRSSAVDGIRRKYYSLTPKGNKYLDKNREQWSASKALVDNLMDTETPTAPTPQLQKPIETVDEFENFKAFVQNNIGDFSVDSSKSDENYFDSIGQDVLSDLNQELLKLNETEEENQVEETLAEPETEEIPEPTVEPTLEDYESMQGRTKNEVLAFELEEEPEPQTEEIDPQAETQQTENEVETIAEEPIEELLSFEPQAVESPTEEEFEPVENFEKTPEFIEEKPEYSHFEEFDGYDDFLNLEDSVPTNRNEYKQLLSRLLPKQNENKPEQPVEEPKIETPIEKPPVEEPKIEPEPIFVETPPTPPVQEPIQDTYEPKTLVDSDPSDFSDLYKMAEEEGFKIRTSYNTNRFISSGILINKLRLTSSLLFFILIALQGLILNFALGRLLDWTPTVKLIILGCLAIYPLITLFMYILSSKRCVNEVMPFKDAMGVALIITFQLAILILCVAMFVGVDLNNFVEVLTFIILPFVLVINIPIYFILKYSLLSTGKYFTE